MKLLIIIILPIILFISIIILLITRKRQENTKRKLIKEEAIMKEKLIKEEAIIKEESIMKEKLTENQLTYIHNVLSDLMKKVSLVFEKNKIKYFIQGGTLLGAVREGDFIKHDDDIDLGVFKDDYERIIFSKNVQDDFKKHGIKVSVSKDVELVKLKFDNVEHEIFIDVFQYRYTGNNKVHYNYDVHKKAWPNGWFNHDDIINLTYYKFRDMILPGPKNPEEYFVRHYGEDWRIPRKTHNHIDEMQLSDNCNGKC